MSIDSDNYKITRNTVSRGSYRYCPQFTNAYCWIPLPEFEITIVRNKNWSELERL